MTKELKLKVWILHEGMNLSVTISRVDSCVFISYIYNCSISDTKSSHLSVIVILASSVLITEKLSFSLSLISLRNVLLNARFTNIFYQWFCISAVYYVPNIPSSLPSISTSSLLFRTLPVTNVQLRCSNDLLYI